jgi:beta-glucanase (GH16 family)
MLGENIGDAGWPDCGEVDIMENIGKEPDTVWGSLHGPGFSNDKQDPTAPFRLKDHGRLADDFHVYAVEWEKDVIRWYVDDKLYETVKARDLPPGGKWVFDRPFFLLLNLAIGGDWPGSPDDKTKFPAEMAVDYVRVYQRDIK